MYIKIDGNQMLPTFDYTITILNKLKASDSSTRQDVWYKTVVKNCAFSKSNKTNISGNTVSSGALFTIRVPKSENYLPYSKWINGPDGYFTFSGGDYVVKGEIDEIPTSSNILTIYNKYRENACKITFIKDNTGTIECMEHYRIEGV